ncbi:MAG: hypothetical protein JSR56_05520 [Proteobacteria bacterium]|nr:hypothetical protein [Pseudomonadota bacterium]
MLTTAGNHASNSSSAAAMLKAWRWVNPPANASTPHTGNTSNSHGARRGMAEWRSAATLGIGGRGLAATGECI